VGAQSLILECRPPNAEGLCLSLIRQLVGGVDGTPVYLRSVSGAGVTELDRYAVNAILARAGLVLKSKATASARTVQTKVEPGKVGSEANGIKLSPKQSRNREVVEL
jgi:hypothetical protein